MLPAVLVPLFRPIVLMLSPITFLLSLPERVYHSDYSGHSESTKLMQEGAQDNHLIRDSKLKAYLQAIRTHPEVRGRRKALPWPSVQQTLRDSGQEHYDLGPSTYSRWYNDNEGKQTYDLVIKNVRSFVSLPQFRHIIDRNVRHTAAAAPPTPTPTPTPTQAAVPDGWESRGRHRLSWASARQAAAAAAPVQHQNHGKHGSTSRLKDFEYSVSVGGKLTSFTVRHPAHMALFPKRHHTVCEGKARKWDNLQNSIKNNKQCSMSNLATTLVWSMMTVAPSLSPDSLSTIISLAYLMLVEQLGLDTCDKDLINSLAHMVPSPSTLRNQLLNLGQYTSVKLKHDLDKRGGTPVFCASDAGNRKGEPPARHAPRPR